MCAVVLGSLCSSHRYCSSVGIPSSRVDPSKVWDENTTGLGSFIIKDGKQANKLLSTPPTNGPRQLRCAFVSGRVPGSKKFICQSSRKIVFTWRSRLRSLLLDGWLSSLRGAAVGKSKRMAAVWRFSSRRCREAPEPEAGRDFFFLSGSSCSPHLRVLFTIITYWCLLNKYFPS